MNCLRCRPTPAQDPSIAALCAYASLRILLPFFAQASAPPVLEVLHYFTNTLMEASRNESVVMQRALLRGIPELISVAQDVSQSVYTFVSGTFSEILKQAIASGHLRVANEAVQALDLLFTSLVEREEPLPSGTATLLFPSLLQHLQSQCKTRFSAVGLATRLMNDPEVGADTVAPLVHVVLSELERCTPKSKMADDDLHMAAVVLDFLTQLSKKHLVGIELMPQLSEFAAAATEAREDALRGRALVALAVLASSLQAADEIKALDDMVAEVVAPNW